MNKHDRVVMCREWIALSRDYYVWFSLAYGAFVRYEEDAAGTVILR